MYSPPPLAAPPGTMAAGLADQAIDHRLTIYAGAGISAPEPTGLPGAGRLAELLADAATAVFALPDVDHADLVAVADLVAAQPGGTVYLKTTLLRVADFTGSRPSHAHCVIGLLLCEGAVTVLETNYDDCIERAALPERLPVVVTDEDRLEVSRTALLKVHGCATRPRTMLVTSSELAAPPLFASAELTARMASGSVAFIGIGSPADYVRSSLSAFVTKVRADNLFVVGPQMANWTESGWPAILPDLPEAQRIAAAADDFSDAILRAYLGRLIGTVRARVNAMPNAHPQHRGVESVVVALEARPAVAVLRWLRSAAWQCHVGVTVAMTGTAVQGLLALGALGGGNAVTIRWQGWAELEMGPSTAHVLLMMAHQAPLGSATAIEAQRRVMDARTAERLPSGCDVVVVCCGQSGPLGLDEVVVAPGARLADIFAARDVDSALAALPENILDLANAEHLVDSVGVGRVLLVAGDRVIEAA